MQKKTQNQNHLSANLFGSLKKTLTIIIGVALLQLLSVNTVKSAPISFEMYPYYEQDVVPVPLDEPWGYVSLTVQNNTAYFDVGIYDAILGYFEQGYEPQVEFFWFNYDNQINSGDVIFNSSLNWQTNPTDVLWGNRGNFDYQMLVGWGLGEQVLNFEIHNLPSGVAEEDFLRTVFAVGGTEAEFRISMNSITPNSGMHLINRTLPTNQPPNPSPVPEPGTLLLMGTGIIGVFTFKRGLSKRQ